MPEPIFTACRAVARICACDSSAAGLSAREDADEEVGSLSGSLSSSSTLSQSISEADPGPSDRGSPVVGSVSSSVPGRLPKPNRLVFGGLSSGAGLLWLSSSRTGLPFAASRGMAVYLSNSGAAVAGVLGRRLDGVGRGGLGGLARYALGRHLQVALGGRARPVPGRPAGGRRRLGGVPGTAGPADPNALLRLVDHGGER